MSETQRIVALGRRALERDQQLCLATVVHVEGSAYRKPGARLLLTSAGEHSGTISGGCLEAEVNRKAWWLTANGPRVERYSSFADEDGGLPYGLGCGGTVSLLLERGEPVRAVLDALARSIDALEPAVLILAVHPSTPPGPGTIAVLSPAAAREDTASLVDEASLTCHFLRDTPLPKKLATAARNALAHQRSCFLTRTFEACDETISVPDGEDDELPAYRVEYLAPPPALTIFGAGDDAQPLAELAHTLGWRITVADGRAHLARRDRFPHAYSIRFLNYADPSLRAACGIAVAPFQAQDGSHRSIPFASPIPAAIDTILSDDLAVILTHSYEQDRALLAALLPRNLRYLGILGPRHRTERLLSEVTPALGLTLNQSFARLHSPVGLDLGSGDPATVALSILAEIQAMLQDRQVLITRNDDRATQTELVPEFHA